MTPKTSYIVCTTPRSGSTLLCNALSQTGVAGIPAEFFIPGYRDEFLRSGQLRIRTYTEYLEKVVFVSTTSNGVFGTKVHAYQTPFFLGKIQDCLDKPFSSLQSAIEAAWPSVKYVLLSRNDKIAQAVSYYRAILSGEWWHYSNNKVRAGDPNNVSFDQYGIKRCLELVEQSDRYWEEYFKRHSIEPLRLTYEQLSVNYEETVRSTLAYLNLPSDVYIQPPATEKMRNESSNAWASEFVAREKSNPLLLSPRRELWAPL